MLDFTLFDNALKIVRVKRLCANDERLWKFIPLSLLSNVGGCLLFQCNYNIQYLPLNENLPKFYRDIISHWQKIKNTNPKTKRDVLNQTIWNNQFIRVNKSSVFSLAGIKSALKNSPAFSTTKVILCRLSQLSCKNITWTVCWTNRRQSLIYSLIHNKKFCTVQIFSGI